MEKLTQDDLVWDEQICHYRKPKNFQREWEKDGCIYCPGCDELLIREKNQKLIYCDNCGYDF